MERKLNVRRRYRMVLIQKTNIYNVVVFVHIFDCLTYDIEKKELNLSLINMCIIHSFEIYFSINLAPLSVET